MLLTAFDENSPDLGWQTVNDNVMGGRSVGGFRVEEGVLLFSGATNTNGGGFSSIRSTPTALELDDAEGVKLRIRGDGRTYTFRLETGRGVTYWAEFRTRGGDDWEEVQVPFADFTPRWRGQLLDGPPLDRAAVESLGIMIYDNQDGPFRLEVDWIESY